MEDTERGTDGNIRKRGKKRRYQQHIVRHVKNREHTHGASCPGKRQERECGGGGLTCVTTDHVTSSSWTKQTHRPACTHLKVAQHSTAKNITSLEACCDKKEEMKTDFNSIQAQQSHRGTWYSRNRRICSIRISQQQHVRTLT